jgi:hypothetical protein
MTEERSRATTIRRVKRVEVVSGNWKDGVGKVADLINEGYRLVHQRHDSFGDDWDGRVEDPNERFYALLEKEE